MSKIIRTLTRGLAAHPRNWVVLVMIGIGMGVWASGAQISKLRTLEEPDCIQVRLSDYNLFLLEDYHQGTDVQGKVAAGGHITLSNFSVGAGLPDSNTSNALVAGGNLSLSNGGVHGDAWYGGSLTSDSSVTFSRGTASQGRPVDFAARGAELRGLSSRLASLPMNGVTTREPWGGVMLRGTDPQVNVFDMDASIFAGAVLLSIDAPTGSLAVLNIHGASVTFTGFGHSFSGGIDQRGVLFNFPEATVIAAQGYGFWGTVLAPNAHLSFNNGSFDGGIYARAMTGNAEGHLNPLNDRDICLSDPLPNNPPIVALSSPADGANFTDPATISIAASASDSDGSVARVDFLSNGALIGSATTAPYAFTWSNVGLGTYSLTARAIDNRGAVTVSSLVVVSVGPPNALPAVALKSPTSGTSFSAPASVHAVATASDSDGTITRVDFLRDGVVAATATTPPYEATISGITAGSHTLVARAVDDRGGFADSAAATLSVVATSLTITSPPPNASITGDSVLVTGTTAGLSNRGVTVNDVVAAVDAAGNFSALVPVTPGGNTLTAQLTTPDGTLLTRSVTIVATGDASPFTVTADPTVGMAPLAVNFTVKNPTANNASYMFDSFGPFSLPAGGTSQLSLNYPAGVFAPNIVITDSTGMVRSHRLVVDSRDPARMDQLFRAIWSNMNAALVASDKEGALRYLSVNGQQKFGPVFDTLMPYMAEIVASYSTLAKGSIGTDISEYAVARMDQGAKRLYLINFVCGIDGVWRIDEM